MSSVPSVAQIRAQVKSVRDRYPDARAIGIRMPALDEATPAPSVLRVGCEECFLSSNAAPCWHCANAWSICPTPGRRSWC